MLNGSFIVIDFTKPLLKVTIIPVSENLIPIVYDYVNNRLLNKSLDDLPGNRMHREALETRVQRIPRREKTALERSFFTQIEDSYGTYERLAQLDAGVLVDRIYEAITSS